MRSAFAQAESEIAGGISPRVALMADIRDVGGCSAAAHARQLRMLTGSRSVTRIFRLMADLRGMGEQNALLQHRKPTSRQLSARSTDLSGTLRTARWINSASFEIITLTGWAHAKAAKPCVREAPHRMMA